MRFSIDRVQDGWFDITFEYCGKIVNTSASNVWGNDSPKIFIELLCRIIEEEKEYSFVMWDEEPGEFFWCFEREKKSYKMIIAFSQKADAIANEYYNKSEGIKKYIEIKNDFPDLYDILVADINIIELASSVIDEFYKIDSNEYEENWMNYPYKQLKDLKRLIEQWK